MGSKLSLTLKHKKTKIQQVEKQTRPETDEDDVNFNDAWQRRPRPLFWSQGDDGCSDDCDGDVVCGVNAERDSQNNVIIYGNERARSLTLETVHLSCHSDAYKGANTKYGGIILYAYDGKTDWRKNGIHCKCGYLIILESAPVMEKYPRQPGQVHGAIYRHIFGEKPNRKVVGEGFALIDGELKINSGVFNIEGEYHDRRRQMSEITERCVKEVIAYWRSAGKDFTKCQNFHVKDLQFQ